MVIGMTMLITYFLCECTSLEENLSKEGNLEPNNVWGNKKEKLKVARLGVMHRGRVERARGLDLSK